MGKCVTQEKIKKKDGTVVMYPKVVRYKLKQPKVMLTEEQKQDIVKRHKMGVPKTKLAKDFHISAYRIGRIITGSDDCCSSDEEKVF
jgi:DNA invertase Pin-like site-specific DNA recombinase